MTAHQRPRSAFPADQFPCELVRASPERTAYNKPMDIPMMRFMER